MSLQTHKMRKKDDHTCWKKRDTQEVKRFVYTFWVMLHHPSDLVNRSTLSKVSINKLLNPSHSKTPLTSFFTVIMRSIELCIIVRDLNAGNNQVVLFVRGVRSQHQPVDSVVLSLWSKRKYETAVVNPALHYLHNGLFKCLHFMKTTV